MLLNFEHLKTFYSALKQKMKNFRGNWDQDDPTADDYIKNRPFYSEKTQTKVEVLPVTTVDLDSSSATLHFPLVKGQTYSITWDGKVYNCVAYEYDAGYLMLGNTAIYEYDGGIETDTGEPFAIEGRLDSTEVWFYFPTDDDGSPHTVSIEMLSEEVVVHKIDKKYLPADIGTESLADIPGRVTALESKTTTQDIIVLSEAQAYTDSVAEGLLSQVQEMINNALGT